MSSKETSEVRVQNVKIFHIHDTCSLTWWKKKLPFYFGSMIIFFKKKKYEMVSVAYVRSYYVITSVTILLFYTNCFINASKVYTVCVKITMWL